MYESYPITPYPLRERFSFFQATVDRLFCPMQLQPQCAPSQAFDGCIEAANLGSVRLAKVATSACTVRRRSQDIAYVSDMSYLVKFQNKGESLWTQRDRAEHLRPGDFV